MAVTDKDFGVLVEQVGGLAVQVEALAAQVEELELANLTPAVVRSQWPVEVNRRCGHKETLPFKVSPDSVLGKKYLEAESTKDCNKCEQTRRQKAAIAVAQREADGIEVDTSAMTIRG